MRVLMNKDIYAVCSKRSRQLLERNQHRFIRIAASQPLTPRTLIIAYFNKVFFNFALEMTGRTEELLFVGILLPLST